MSDFFLPLLAISAYSGTGKTTLLKKIIPLLQQSSIRIALIKHSHHNMDIDIPGKDSYELRKLGVIQTIVACDKRWALMTETPHKEVTLTNLTQSLNTDEIDLVLVEGFKQEPIPKIVLFREKLGYPFEGLIDRHVIALATDKPRKVPVTLLDINDPIKICRFIIDWLKTQRR